MRIVSLLPSATEIVCQLGLEEQLVGVTHECDYPPRVASLPKVTRTLVPPSASSREIDELVRERLSSRAALYELDQKLLEQLQPDVIVTQTLCDVCAVADEEVRAAACSLLSQPSIVNLAPMSLSGVFASLLQVGRATNSEAKALEVVEHLERRVASVAERSRSVLHKPSVMFLEWIDPPFSAGHWNPELVELAGGQEVIGRAGRPSQTTEWDAVRAADPDVLFIACCGYSIDRTVEDMPLLVANPGFAKLKAVESGRVFIADGSAYFNRPGPRLVDSLEILAHALHPELHPLPSHLEAAVRVTKERR